jgi:hypothetical protein
MGNTRKERGETAPNVKEERDEGEDEDGDDEEDQKQLRE